MLDSLITLVLVAFHTDPTLIGYPVLAVIAVTILAGRLR